MGQSSSLPQLILGGKRSLSPLELQEMSFQELRQHLLKAFVSTDGVSTKEGLVELYNQEYEKDHSHLPLVVARKQTRHIHGTRAGVLVGLNACTNPRCYRTEDGYTAFKKCTGCKMAVYCGPHCQREHWTESVAGHKRSCKRIKSQMEKAGLHKQPVLPGGMDGDSSRALIHT